MWTASPSCFRLFLQVVPRATLRALFSAGSSIEARMAMIAITTRSSIRVKEELFFFMFNSFQLKLL